MIKEKLDTEFIRGETSQAVFELRALLEHVYQVLNETINRVNEIVSAEHFDSIDANIKQEGASIQDILKTTKDALDNHSEFLNWTKPSIK